MAKEIGHYFPQIDDQLVNLLELNQINHSDASLIAASINQKAKNIAPINFSEAIDWRSNLRYLYIFCGVISTLVLLSLMSPGSFSSSSKRILQFQTEFERPMPFTIKILNPELSAYKNEDFTLSFDIIGQDIPQNIYLKHENGRRVRLQSSDNQTFTYKWVNVQEPINYRIEAAGYITNVYNISLKTRPEISGFTLRLDYPSYTDWPDETFTNIGSAAVPEGTKISWLLETRNTNTAKILFSDSSYFFDSQNRGSFEYSKRVWQNEEYAVQIANEYGTNKNDIKYSIDVIKDLKPEIEASFLKDTLYFSSVIISGKIKDDYGFSKMRLYQKGLTEQKLTSIPVKINRDLPEQSFVYRWNIDSALLNTNESVELWVTIWDNDQVNGYKESRSQKFFFRKPTKAEVDQLLAESSDQTAKKLEKAQAQTQKLNENLEELQNRLKNKKELGWQEQKLLEEVISKKKEIEKSVEELQRKHEELINSQERFNKHNDKLAEKSKQLQKLMDELLDDETKALYDELQKLLEEKSSLDEVTEQLSKIQPDEKNLENELERAIELFKKMKLESKIEETAQTLEELGKKQEQLAQKDITEESLQEQQEINDAFEEVKDGTDEIEELNQEMENPEPLEDFNEQEEEISQELEDITEDMQNGKNSKKTKSKQQNAGNKMNQMASKMRQMQESMEMEMMQENMQHLRDILDNLVKISFEQERIIKGFRGVSQSDPRFLELSQDQLKLVENSKVIEDSLLSLAKRVLQISNFVTREIDQINRSLENAMVSVKDRNKNRATSHQQFAMTSMNNLALLLDDVMQQMQEAMSAAGSGSGSKKGKKKGSTPSMSQLQKQLSEQIQDLKKSGKSGRQLSEDLARLAAEQAKLRQELQKMQDKLDGQNNGGESGGTGLKEAIEKMEQNEVDLVNKRLTQNLINRQKDIISRMLEAEKSMREQEQDPQRKGETANQLKRKYPPAFEEYLKARESEIELLNTIPLDLNPFYKKEVNEYFRRLSVQED
ncbi:MAG: hypothetical protein ABJ004_04795 [Cyclobacteriaceae bacterium]